MLSGRPCLRDLPRPDPDLAVCSAVFSDTSDYLFGRHAGLGGGLPTWLEELESAVESAQKELGRAVRQHDANQSAA
jgi:hypothetical protein